VTVRPRVAAVADDSGRLSGVTGAGRGAGSLSLRRVAASHYLTGQQKRARGLGAMLGGVAAGRFIRVPRDASLSAGRARRMPGWPAGPSSGNSETIRMLASTALAG